MIDEEGNELESWTLKHAWIKSVDFSDLDYSSDEMSEVTVNFRYDWAQYETIRNGNATDTFFAVGG